jgi:hypothetical protein
VISSCGCCPRAYIDEHDIRSKPLDQPDRVDACRGDPGNRHPLSLKKRSGSL